jgi:hypothetical protein
VKELERWPNNWGQVRKALLLTKAPQEPVAAFIKTKGGGNVVLLPVLRFDEVGITEAEPVSLIPHGEGDVELCPNEKLVDGSRFFNVHGCGGIDKSFEPPPVI